jgi:hypothetical protein
MIFRFTLSHAVLGSQVISECDGWKECKLKLERHEDFHSLIEYFEGDFVFYGDNGSENGGIDFIREVEHVYGPDAELAITIEIAPDNVTYQTVFIGQLDLWNIEEMPDNKAQVPIIRNDFWAKFINRYDTPVNIQSPESIDGDAVDVFDSVSLRLSSQKIQKTTRYDGRITPLADDPLTKYSLPTGDIDANGANDDYTLYTQATLDLVQTEINESFGLLSFAFVDDIIEVFNIIEFIDEGGPLHIEATARPELHIRGALAASSSETDPSSIDDITILATLYVKKNDEAPTALDFAAQTQNGPSNPTVGFPVIFSFFYDLPLAGSIDLDVVPGDTVTVYVQYEILFNIDVGSDPGSITWTERYVEFTSYESDVEFVLQSVFQENNSESFLLHDVAGQVIDRLVSEGSAFYSEFLGSNRTVYRQYEGDGCAWEYALTKGLQLRRYTILEKPFFQSFKQWWEGANPILNLGLGYETIVGQENIRVEEKRHFYDDSDVSLNIDFVRDIVRKYDDARVFKAVKIGYKKWQSEDISGIDDPQTKKTYATILKKAGREITLESEFIAASLAIETTRRKTREKSADYKFDNDTFIIAINPVPVDVSPETDPDVTDYEPELDENFDSITNLLNSETRYNLRLTPARNFLRWQDWLSAGLQAYPDSTFKFSAAEGNYDMTSDIINTSDGCVENRLNVSEKQDMPVSADPFHLASLYEIKCPLDWDDYVLIRDNRKMAIGISQTDENHVKFFIKDLEYEVVQGLVSMLAWSVEFMNIEVIESETQMRVCAPVLPCEDAYLTELGDEYITESGDCLVLN